MSEAPREIVLDYKHDQIRYCGEVLPFSLSAAQSKAVVEHGRTVLTLTLDVEQLRTVAPAPEPTVSIEKPMPTPTAEQMFERQMQQARDRQAKAGR